MPVPSHYAIMIIFFNLIIHYNLDLSLAVRFLEHVKFKCGSKKARDIVYPYIIQEVERILFLLLSLQLIDHYY
jgi:hypothetical protein